MLFNSWQFLLFFPVVILIYYLFPTRFRKVWLVVASYYFYMCWDAKYAILILLTTVITYLSGILLFGIDTHSYSKKKKLVYRRIIVIVSFASNLGILFFFKYFEWLIDNLNLLFSKDVSLPFSIVLPVGISFYTFQALSYTVDVYRGEITAEKKFINYALFVSFFPQLVAGPIERSKNLLSQLDCNKGFDYDNAKNGLLLMLWGFFEKIVIADKAAMFVDSVYNDYAEQYGSVIALATIMFAIQIYCDFGGYSHIAIGAAKVLNVKLMDNFRQPYLALSIHDFWNRWHISLSSWFRDYLYIPMGGNRHGKICKYRNLFVTFLASGLWHGASWHFVFWGMIHGLYQILSDLLSPLSEIVRENISIKRDCFSYILFRRLVTFVLVDFAWLFFRANSMSDAIILIKKMIFEFHPSGIVAESIWSCGLDKTQMITLVFAIVMLLIVDNIHEMRISIIDFLNKQNLIFRWGVYYSAILFIIVSLIQTFGTGASTFIYFQF